MVRVPHLALSSVMLIGASSGCSFDSKGQGGGQPTFSEDGSGSSSGGTSAATDSTTQSSTSPTMTVGTTDSETSATTDATSGSETTGGAGTVTFAPIRDATIAQETPENNFGATEDLHIGSGSSSNNGKRALVYFDVSGLKPECNIVDAQLRLYYFADGAQTWSQFNPVFNAYRVTESWTQGAVTWTSRDGTVGWTAAGGSHDAIALDATTVVGGTYGWVPFDLTQMARDWCNGTFENHGVLLRELEDHKGDRGRKLFHSQEYVEDSDLRPVLEIELGP